MYAQYICVNCQCKLCKLLPHFNSRTHDKVSNELHLVLWVISCQNFALGDISCWSTPSQPAILRRELHPNSVTYCIDRSSFPLFLAGICHHLCCRSCRSCFNIISNFLHIFSVCQLKSNRRKCENTIIFVTYFLYANCKNKVLKEMRKYLNKEKIHESCDLVHQMALTWNHWNILCPYL